LTDFLIMDEIVFDFSKTIPQWKTLDLQKELCFLFNNKIKNKNKIKIKACLHNPQFERVQFFDQQFC